MEIVIILLFFSGDENNEFTTESFSLSIVEQHVIELERNPRLYQLI